MLRAIEAGIDRAAPYVLAEDTAETIAKIICAEILAGRGMSVLSFAARLEALEGADAPDDEQRQSPLVAALMTLGKA